MAALGVALVALALPFLGLILRVEAGSAVASASPGPLAAPFSSSTILEVIYSTVQPSALDPQASQPGSISSETIKALGIPRLSNPADARRLSARLAQRLLARSSAQASNRELAPQVGQPLVLNAQSALSAALITSIGGRDNQFSEVALLADWDGREDCVADRAQKLDDFSFNEPEIDQSLTRTAISEHTVANGYTENVYYYGDTLGNFYIGTDVDPGINTTGLPTIDTVTQVNIPELVSTGASGGFTLLNPIAGDCTDDQVTITGIAVNPVADLGDFGLCDTIGEVVYVSILDTEGCSNNASNQVFRTRIFAFGFTDGAGAAAATPAGAIQILRNQFSNIAGVAVDDDGSLYFQLVDLVQFTTSAIFKVSEGPRTVAGCAVNPRRNRVIASIPSGLTDGITLTSAQGTGSSPALDSGGYRLTNYSGPSTAFGNIVSMTAGPCNVLYAAVARSFVATDDQFTQITEGRFTNPSALGATPSMIISFADCS
ncbi:MAG TPA: hypothetical protein VNO14_10090, partial [Blastocatellia bacterium]|nr:hypothetical protein [Blastocatellia bacterium]